MRPSEYQAFLEKALPQGDMILAVGPQGIGKTQIPEDLTRSWGWKCFAVCMPMIDPTFLMGYPFNNGGRADHLPYGIMREILETKDDCLFIMDEIGGASEAVQKAGLRFLQFGEIAGKIVGPNVRRLALSNDVTHGAGVLGMIEPAKSRFDTIITVEPNVTDTVQYGLAHNWPAWLIAYLRHEAGALYDYKPVKSMQIGGSDPRGWERVAKLDSQGWLDSPIASEIICGRVGKGRGTQALAFRGLVNDLPDIDHCILDPENAPVPDGADVRWFVSMAMAQRMTARNFGQCVKYLLRLPALFRAFSIRDAFRGEAMKRKEKKLPKDWVPLNASRDFSAWATSADGQEIMAAAA